MVLCIWTALHLNIPCDEHTLAKKGRLSRFWYDGMYIPSFYYGPGSLNTGADQSNASDRIRKVRWIAMGLFAPELVVYNAWMQRRKVNEITRDARESQRMAKELGVPQVFEWTQYHSWYMIMGGFYFRTKNNGTVDEFIPGSPDLILTADAMPLLTRTAPPLLPEIEVDVIKDHSKADVVAKALALLQALYQFLSVISRLVLRLPVSQLEINTFGHVLCAFAILSIWFRKPKDIKVRTQIRDEWANPLCAYLWMCSELSCTTGTLCLEHRKLFPLPRKGTIEENTAGRKGGQSQVSDQDEPKRQAGKEFGNGHSFERDCIDHRMPLEKSSESTDLMSNKPQTSAEPVRMPLPDASSPTRSIATLYEQSPPVLTTPRSSFGNDDSSRLTSLRSKPTSAWTSWALPRIDPVQDPEAFKKVMRPALKEKFQPAEIAYDSTTTANRACLAMSYVRFWTINNVKGFNPATACLGVKAYDHSVRPPIYQGTLITDHVSDWFNEPESRIWYSTKVVPALSIALLTTCYGALHGWAWHAHFPTKVGLNSAF